MKNLFNRKTTSFARLVSLLIVLVLAATQVTAGGNNYKIVVKLKNASDSLLILARYEGAKQYVVDTARLKTVGEYVFSGSDTLQSGMYLVAGQQKKKYFDFFIDGQPKFELACDVSDVVNTMQVKGSADNKAFYGYVKYLGQKQKQVEPVIEWLKKQGKSRSDSVILMRKKADDIDLEAKTFVKKYYQSDPSSLACAFVKANTEPDYQGHATRPDGSLDSALLYKEFKSHYFDNINLADNRLFRTPVIAQKLDYYLDKVCPPVVDSLKKEIDHIFQLSQPDPKMQQYLGWFLSLKYETSNIMGLDALFVYIVRNYLEPGKVGWLYPVIRETVIKRVAKLETLLIGNTAPNLILLDTAMQVKALSDVKAKYTLLFFWESTCSHCKQEMPKVLKFYEEFHNAYGLEIYGVSADTSLSKMKAYIIKNNMRWINVNGHYTLSGDYHELYDIRSTPIMYLLDEHKRIVTKFLLTDEIANVIRRREGKANQ